MVAAPRLPLVNVSLPRRTPREAVSSTTGATVVARLGDEQLDGARADVDDGNRWSGLAGDRVLSASGGR